MRTGVCPTLRLSLCLPLFLVLGCTGHVHEDVEEPEIEEAEAEDQPEDPGRWDDVTEEWSQTKPPVEAAKDLFQRGMKAYRVGDYEAALDDFRAAYDLQPLDPLRYNIAMCLEQLGRFEEAIVEVEALANGAQEPFLRSEAAQKRDALRRKLAPQRAPSPP